MKGKIHFRNEPFMARVAGKSNVPIECTPVVYDDMADCGVGVFYKGGGQVWGMVTPRNLVAAWRGTEVLRRLNTIEHGTLAAAYYTGVRDPHESDVKSHVEPTIAKIGRAAYSEIMAMPVPEQIIRAILDNRGDPNVAPDLYPITDEVRAGTIQWRQEFAEAGIKHPDEIDAKKRAQEEIVAKFERLLASYADSRNLPRQCVGMGFVEGALLTLVEEGAGQNPADVLVALAGVVSELAISEFSVAMVSYPCSREEYDAQMAQTKERAIDHSVEWLASNSRRSRLWFWKRQQDSFTRASAKELLRSLLGEYFPPKSEAPPA